MEQENMSGLARICKMYGSMEVSDANGKKATWFWDYKNDKPRLKSEMTKEEIAESEKVKWQQVKAQMSEQNLRLAGRRSAAYHKL
jgi:major membrane immunogen (membrane-anchored lipoprotein)